MSSVDDPVVPASCSARRRMSSADAPVAAAMSSASVRRGVGPQPVVANSVRTASSRPIARRGMPLSVTPVSRMGTDPDLGVRVLGERRASGTEHGEREQRLAGGADLDLGAHLGADAAVEAGGPAAVLDLGLVEGVEPVLPEPLLVEPGVDVVPRQHLALLALARGVPGDVD